ncbi:MAG: GNAT family protein [Candidatus Cloacimonetes bacterium]|nr:GNAT family protein [Candidatus Cloacimonadota bacterium]
MNLKDAFMRFPELRTERLRLRKIQASDAEMLCRLYSNPEVNRYLDWYGPQVVSEAEVVIAFLEQQYSTAKALRWALTLPSTNELIGTVLLSNFQKSALADLGYDLARPYWGKGLMQEALLEVLHFAFAELGLIRISAYVRPENTASANLLERLDFVQEGTLRKAGYHESKNEFFDVQLFARIQEID